MKQLESFGTAWTHSRLRRHTTKRLFDAYRAALPIVSGIAPSFKREITFAGGGILFKRPPWLSFLSEET
jgi:hypothetical protein